MLEKKNSSVDESCLSSVVYVLPLVTMKQRTHTAEKTASILRQLVSDIFLLGRAAIS